MQTKLLNEAKKKLYDYNIPISNWKFRIISLIITVSLRNKIKKLGWYYINNIL